LIGARRNVSVKPGFVPESIIRYSAAHPGEFSGTSLGWPHYPNLWGTGSILLMWCVLVVDNIQGTYRYDTTARAGKRETASQSL
jgi:hypothetical protein